jgi:anaerobic magnesium-protoporphyrin IX monomethyl ester cyclase
MPKLLLVHPPQIALYMPYLALPSLTAYLRGHGKPCDQVDLNVRANRRLISERGLREAMAAVERRFGPGGRDAPDDVRAALELGPDTITRLPAALRDMRDDARLLDDEAMTAAFGLLDRALALASAPFHPTKLSYDLSMRYAPNHVADLQRAVRDEAENPWLRLFREELVPEMLRGGYDVVGIGIAFEEQMIGALTLARVIKELAPHVVTVAGGNVVSKFHTPLLAKNFLFEEFDHAIVYEGETPLERLCDALDARAAGSAAGHGAADLAAVPNLLWRDGATLRVNEMMYEQVPSLPPPVFDGFPVDPAAGDGYLLGHTIFPLLSVRGCYWKKCAFCTHHHSYGWRYRVRPPQQLDEDIETLARRYGARHFYFVDEAVPPAQLKVIADYMCARDGGPLHWFGDMRFEQPLTDGFCRHLYAGGCRMLIFGLESANQRVQDFMDKNVKVGTMERALRACTQNGIFTVTMFFTGFPTETLQEAKDTADFIFRNKPWIGTFSNGSFALLRGAPAQLDPDKYGITSLQPDPDHDLSDDYRYSVRTGLTQESAQRIAESIGRRRTEDEKFGKPFSRELILLRESLRPPPTQGLQRQL